MRPGAMPEWREQSIQSSPAPTHTSYMAVPCISRSLRTWVACQTVQADEQDSTGRGHKADRRDLLVVPWLRLCLPARRGEGLIPSQGAKIRMPCSQKPHMKKQTGQTAPTRDTLQPGLLLGATQGHPLCWSNQAASIGASHLT